MDITPTQASKLARNMLRGSYVKALTWDKFAAAAKHGYMPSQGEFIKEGLMLFHRMMTGMYPLTTKAVAALVDDIVKEMESSIIATTKGHFVYDPPAIGGEVRTGYDVKLDEPVLGEEDEECTIGTLIGVVEEGYADVENNEEMQQRLTAVALRISDSDMDILLGFVDGVYDTLTQACGSVDEMRNFQKRIRRACGGLKTSHLFR